MNPQHVGPRNYVFRTIREAITTNDNTLQINIAKVGNQPPRMILLALRHVDGRGENLLMLAIRHGKNNLIEQILDMLHLGVTIYGHWDATEFTNFLCSADHEGNNVLQLSIIYGERGSDWLQQKLLAIIAEICQERRSELVRNRNRQVKSSVILAIEHRLEKNLVTQLLEYGGEHEQDGTTRIIIFHDDDATNITQARFADRAFHRKGFYVTHINYIDWDSTTLCGELKKCSQGQFHHLWILGLVQGDQESILDRHGQRIPIEDVRRTVREAQAMDKIVVIAVNETHGNGNDDENNVMADRPPAAQPVQERDIPPGEPHVLVVSGRVEGGLGEILVSPLVQYINDGETDVCRALNNAVDEAVERSRTQGSIVTVRRPEYPEEGDVTMPH